MAEKAFFGASKSEVSRMKREVEQDVFGSGGKKRTKKRTRSRKNKR